MILGLVLIFWYPSHFKWKHA